MTPVRRILLAAACALPVLLVGLAESHAQLRRDRARQSQAKECVDCHEDESKEYRRFATPHAPAATGDCESCHLKHGIVGVLRLRAPDPQVCLACHAREGDAATGKGAGSTAAAAGKHLFTHPPGTEMRCGACHAPHGSARPHALREAKEGEAATDCLSCHPAQGGEGATRHPADRVDCLSCHDAHGSTIEANLSRPVDQVCTTCHYGACAGERRAHGGGAPPAASCLGCHTPHVAAGAGLLRRNVHAPMADGCDACHAGSGATPFALNERGAALCLSCHDDPGSGLAAAHGDKARTHVPVAEGDCLACHSPHAADHAALLKDSQPVVCGSCHLESQQARDAVAPHPPATEECTMCHLPHGGPENLMRAGTVADLCADCHDVGSQVARGHAHPPAAEGECLTCHAPHGSGHAGILTEPQGTLCGGCHDLTEDQEARVRHAPMLNGECSMCHEPHGADAARLVVASLSEACLACHESARSDAMRPAQHPPFAEGECLACHSPHSSPRRALLTTHSSRLCLECHDAVEASSTGSTHLPVRRGECLGCHAPHGGHDPGILMVADTRLLCATCHEDLGRHALGRSASVHAPFKDDSCLTCHAPHTSPHDVLLAEAPGGLCATCHDIADPKLRAPHRGLLDADTDCSACHEPHVSEVEKLLIADQHRPFLDKDCGACHRGTAR